MGKAEDDRCHCKQEMQLEEFAAEFSAKQARQESSAYEGQSRYSQRLNQREQRDGTYNQIHFFIRKI